MTEGKGTPALLSVTDLSELLGVPPSWVYRRTARGHPESLPHYKLGGLLRFKREEIEEWVEQHRVEREEWKPKW